MKYEIINTLISLMNEKFLIHVSHLSENMHLNKHLGLNEFEKNEVLFYLESQYNIEANDLDVNKIVTVGQLSNYFEEKLRKVV
jgi:acyl carrier protein